MDGGAIQFRSYNEGVVNLMLQGSCSGCPSSMITLKAGIEGMMKRMIPEVREWLLKQSNAADHFAITIRPSSYHLAGVYRCNIRNRQRHFFPQRKYSCLPPLV